MFLPLCRLRQLKRHVGDEVTRQLIRSFIISRLDYCNAVLIDLSLFTIALLQPVKKDAAARLILELSRRTPSPEGAKCTLATRRVQNQIQVGTAW